MIMGCKHFQTAQHYAMQNKHTLKIGNFNFKQQGFPRSE
jgi:hypothetical protein